VKSKLKWSFVLQEFSKSLASVVSKTCLENRDTKRETMSIWCKIDILRQRYYTELLIDSV